MSAQVVRVVVTGVAGRMGARILGAARAEWDLLVVGATERPGSPHIGVDAGLLSGSGPLQVMVAATLEEALGNGADVVIDFTAPGASLHHAAACAKRKVALVVGTTGFSAQARAELAAHGREIPILMAPNMSVGVNVLLRLVAEAARALGPSFEVEIVELHHRAKKDAPSGTALGLADAAASALGLDPHAANVYQRHGDIGARKPGSIGMQSLRGGDVVGDHTVFVLADGARLEMTHRASSRDNFARGAVRAARFLVLQKPGLYDMQDVLGFHR